MAGSYEDQMYAQARSQVMRITAETDALVLQAYQDAGEDLVKKYAKSKEGSATRAYYTSYIRALHEQMEAVITRAGLTTAEIPVNMQKLLTEKVFQDAGIKTSIIPNFNKTYGAIPERTVARIASGSIYADSATLSNRIWGASLQAGDNMQRIIASGLANQVSATQMARTLEAYVDPAARRTWDRNRIREVLGDGYANWNRNLEYNSLRLARTTITHSAQLAMIESCRQNPYIKSIQWHSVFSHGRTCQLCKDRDGKIFLLDEVPLDHPNGLCYQTAHIPQSLNEIADDLKKKVDASDGDLLSLADMLSDWVNGTD